MTSYLWIDMLKIIISVCYLDLLNFNSGVSTAKPSSSFSDPKWFLEFGPLSTTAAFHLPPCPAPCPQELRAPQGQAELDQPDCLGEVTVLSLSPLLLGGQQSEVGRRKPKHPTEAIPVLLTFVAFPVPVSFMCPLEHDIFATNFSLLTLKINLSLSRLKLDLNAKKRLNRTIFS